jgi:hypothetical protein
MAGADKRFPCAQCGAQLRFAPGQTRLTCDHCGHEQPIPQSDTHSHLHALREIPLAEGLVAEPSAAISDEVRTSHCPGCGAVVELVGPVTATECPYCATPVVTDPAAVRRITPQAVLPFALTEDQARDTLTKWLGSLWFAPNNLLEFTRKGRAMAGLYVPFWTFDSDTTSRYSGQRGEHYYETRTVTVTVNGRSEQRQEQVQKTRWYPASGQVARDFDDVLVMASRSLPPRLGEELTPWDLSALVPYTPDYLAGFRAEAYVVPIADAHGDARNRMARVIEGDVRADIGGDVQQIDQISTNWRGESFKHVLLPIWTAAYRYRGRSWQFLVNGQTGEVQGERPWSVWKIGFAILAVAVVAAAVFYLNDPSVFGRELDYRNSNGALPDWLIEGN